MTYTGLIKIKLRKGFGQEGANRQEILRLRDDQGSFWPNGRL